MSKNRFEAVELSDQEERVQSGPRPPAYAHLLNIPVCSPDDRKVARSVLAQIEGTIDRGGWTRNERTRLYRMRNKWRARAEGKDPYYRVFGNRHVLPTRTRPEDKEWYEVLTALQDIEQILGQGGK